MDDARFEIKITVDRDGDNEIIEILKNNCNKGDIFLTLGAGSISSWVNNLPFLMDKPGHEYNE